MKIAVDTVRPLYITRFGRAIFTETTRIGRTSITAHVSVWAQRRFGGGEFAHVTEADVTMVAVDDEGKPTPIVRRQ